jgi:hypothetical protein
MNITITIPSHLAPMVERAAMKRGRDVVTYIQDLVAKDVAAPSLDEILAPVRAEFAASNITEEEFDALIEAERQAIWEEKHQKKS